MINLHNLRAEIQRRSGAQSSHKPPLDKRASQAEKAHYASFGPLSQAAYQRFRERERGVGIFHKSRRTQELQKQSQLAHN